MRRIACLAALVAVSAMSADAATVSTTFDYAKSGVNLGGGESFGFDASTSLNVGIGVVDLGAKASSGTVDAEATVAVQAAFSPVVDIAQARTFAVTLSPESLSYGFETFVGATASAGVNFSFDIPLFGEINPPRISLGEAGFSIETSATGSSFGAFVSDDAKEAITGFGLNQSFLVASLQAEITPDASQESRFRIDDLVGAVRATHESGFLLFDSFSLLSDPLGLLDLSLPGRWELDLVDVALSNLFDTSLGLAASARLGASASFPFNFDVSRVASTPQFTLIDPAPFEIDWGLRSASLGAVTVVTAPIPLPAAGWLLLGGLAALGAMRRAERAAG